MAGTNELNSQENEDSFQWDEQSQLYYHASSGFYHDPAVGWYYSSNDGLYYKFENGSYVPWETDQADESNANQGIGTVGDDSVHEQSYQNAPCDTNTNDVKFEDGEIEGYVVEEATPNEPTVDMNCLTEGLPENLPPPSEWLEDTLIELYLSGYSNKTIDDASDTRGEDVNTPADGVDNDDAYELEEGEWIPDETHEIVDGSGVASDEDPFGDEEMWRAQYGQAIQSDKEVVVLPDCPVVDLWDWSMVMSTKKNGKGRVCRLVGRLIKKSTKLHPSMPSSRPLLKTAPICEAHLDLVRVRSGRVYKLRSPKVAYLATLSSYDSSNPTKDWGFPKLTTNKEAQTKSSRHVESKNVGPHIGSAKELSSSEKHKGGVYRDRAAERRSLHGGFGVGPGQKKSADDIDSCSALSPVFETPEDAAAEALNMSFGVGSYARRMLENMGWKEGETLGSSMKGGLTEPLQAVGNKGSSGLGWNNNTNWRNASF
ncbi:uncharacterized protein LOC111913565 isoform X1 [Lactuca sativa]|uniref:G-patch domain-containing protein n=1 Tax=Lactuca sativa TaxID=4236 RepID=A0A9R1XVG8_LACSA|nr:uncharacterized protein LOC111913565 isoform X1 [Lactuca sativa]KAJ0227349.1 hypothetical protein LSAT_V11C100011440 [Lactuca sativa]